MALTGSMGPSPARADLFDRLEAGGALIMGHRTDAAPFAFIRTNRPVGFSVDLCDLVAAQLRAQLPEWSGEARWTAVSVTERFDALESGGIDMLCGATSVTEERRLRAAFSRTIFITESAILVDAEAFEAEAWGQRIGVLGATTSLKTIDQLLSDDGGEFTELTAFATRPDAVAALKRGAIDSLFGDKVLLEAIIGAYPERYVLSGSEFGEERYAIAFRRDEPRLVAAADAALSAAFRAGEIERLHQQWFDGAPMRDDLRAAFKTADAR
ncbi:MAG: transporter substrate-binding domain-containing protein [Pseudomonadota bacterium]